MRMILAIYGLTIVSALASDEFNLKEVLILGTILSIGVTGLANPEERRRIRRRRRAHRRLRLDHLVSAPLDKARCRDLAFQFLGREVGTGGRQARIERGHRTGQP